MLHIVYLAGVVVHIAKKTGNGRIHIHWTEFSHLAWDISVKIYKKCSRNMREAGG